MSHYRDEQPVRNFRNGSAVTASDMAIAQDNNKAVMSFNGRRYMPFFVGYSWRLCSLFTCECFEGAAQGGKTECNRANLLV
jgi:hypothetical protein